MAATPEVWFVTPAWRRADVTDAVLLQRADLRDALAGKLRLNCVVIADDENLDVARAHGFDAIESRNQLGEKVNRGYAHAVGAGADFVANVDSDSFVHPQLLLDHEWSGDAILSSWYAMLEKGKTLTYCDVQQVAGIGLGPLFLSRRALESVNCTPLLPHLPRQITGKTWEAVTNGLAHRGEGIKIAMRNSCPLQYVGLRTDLQITRGRRADAMWRDVSYEVSTTPFEDLLAADYPAAIVDAARALYSG